MMTLTQYWMGDGDHSADFVVRWECRTALEQAAMLLAVHREDILLSCGRHPGSDQRGRA